MNAVGKGWRVLALAALATGCDGGGTTPSVATTVTATSATSQTTLTGLSVAEAPAVRVLDQRGEPMVGVPVTFATTSGSGTLASPAATTDAGGIASSAGWRLGPAAGTQTATARVADLALVTFTATAQARAATTVVPTSPSSQTAVAGSAVAQAPAVRVNDQAGDPFPGAQVTFAVTAGGGQITPAIAITNAAGVANSGTWTLGTAGQNTVTATVTGVTPVQFSATAQARVPTTSAAVTPTTQIGIVGTPVNRTPIVQVYDQVGQPLPGVAVTLAVTEGGGTLSSTTATTGAGGTAMADNWTLGPVSGRNVLTVTAAGLAPVQFEATGQARAATTIQAVSPTSQSAPPGTAVSQRPSVRVDDQSGQPMAGVQVTFTVTAGGGSATGATATTSAAGVATVGSWTLGTAGGHNMMVAMVPGLAPVHFQATGQVPGYIAAVSPTDQPAPAGTAVHQRPSVQVYDRQGQPMAGAQVTFAVTTGGGTVTGATATTSATGVATVGSWTLGPAAGQNTLTASVAGLSPVTFNATGTVGDPCTTSVTYALGTAVNGSLATTDCRLSTGEYLDFYDTALPAQGVAFNMRSTEVDSWLELYDAAGNLVGFNDDLNTSTTNAALLVYAPAGSYFLAASSQAAGETGAYQLTASSSLAANNSCGMYGMYWVVPGVTLGGSVVTTDCNSDGYLSDSYVVILRPGQSLTMRMQSTFVDAYLSLYDINGALVASDDDSGGGSNALLTYTYTGTTATVFFIDAGTFARGETGSYTLTVTRN